jgi:S-adenosylmethionine hydrolase
MVLTLTTDWGKDYYPGAFKGLIYRYDPSCRIIDLTHQIASFNIAEAAFSLKNAYSFFPEGSVHLIGVGNDYSVKTPFLAISFHGHYFLCNDNGVFGLIDSGEPDQVVEITAFDDSLSPSFPALSVFAPAALHLLSGKSLDALGPVRENFQKSSPLLPTYSSSLITGTIIHIDSFGNAITNVPRDLFEKVGAGRPFVIQLKSRARTIQRISKRYNEEDSGNLMALFNSMDLLEIAIRHGRIDEFLSLGCNDNIRIKFEEP